MPSAWGMTVKICAAYDMISGYSLARFASRSRSATSSSRKRQAHVWTVELGKLHERRAPGADIRFLMPFLLPFTARQNVYRLKF